MTIKRHSVDILKSYDVSKSEDYFSCKEVGALILEVDTLGAMAEILLVSIRWSNSTEIQKEKFPNTLDGFCAACEWLDNKRIEYAEELL